MLRVAIEVEWLKAIAAQGYHCCREGTPANRSRKSLGADVCCQWREGHFRRAPGLEARSAGLFPSVAAAVSAMEAPRRRRDGAGAYITEIRERSSQSERSSLVFARTRTPLGARHGCSAERCCVSLCFPNLEPMLVRSTLQVACVAVGELDRTQVRKLALLVRACPSVEPEAECLVAVLEAKVFHGLSEHCSLTVVSLVPGLLCSLYKAPSVVLGYSVFGRNMERR